MKILFIASEIFPLVKVGGLADVVGALPKFLRAAGHDVRVLIPKYDVIDYDRCHASRVLEQLRVPLGGGQAVVSVFSGTLPNTDLPLYFLDWPGIFIHPIYSEGLSSDDLARGMKRFTYFSWAAAVALPQLEWVPDIIHCHDWHSAPIKTFLRAQRATVVPPTILTIHNLNVQGKWRAAEVFSWLGLHGEESSDLRLRDRDGDYNAMQIGIRAADAVTTVSPTYAQEILTPKFGERLENDLRSRPDGVYGIVNGIDVEAFSPEHDQQISKTYNTDTVVAGKGANKSALLRTCGWSDDGRPLFVSVGRLTPQKGMDALFAAWPAVAAKGARLIVLGSGQPVIEQQSQKLAAQFPDSVYVRIGFDAAFGAQLYAGGDFLLMPSQFEPCGLTQLVAMRYGTIPIVRDTGGLHDTVVDVDLHPGAGSGLVYQDDRLAPTIDRALALYKRQEAFERLRQRIMSLDFSWYNSLPEYLRLYDQVRNRKNS